MAKIKLFIALMIVFAVIGLWLHYQHLRTAPIVVETMLIEIEKGDSFQKITDKLRHQGIAVNPLWFRLLAEQTQLRHKLKTGEYELKQGASALDILQLFVSGKTKQHTITFPEGWTFVQILTQIHQHPAIKPTLILTMDKAKVNMNSLSSEQIAFILDYLGSDYQHVEGLFFPDTYFFEKNTSDLALLKRAYQRMQQVLMEEWATRQTGLPLATPYEALIMASIVEKETGLAEERPLISGVFIRRLQKGMRLQTDPTVIYGMGDAYQGNIKKQDLSAKTPYNTYVIDGLPPTPIAMPGREAIHAALNPAQHQYLYFVARGDGGHVFSNNLKAHNKAVATYQLKR